MDESIYKGFNHYSRQFSFYTYQLQILINSNGFELSNKGVTLQQEVFLTLLNRIGVNISAIHHLSKVLPEENISSSIALLFRSCISDIVLGHYLLIFKDDLNTFFAEIKVKDAEFFKYAQKVSSIEQQLLSNSDAEFEKRKEEIYNILKEEFSEIIDCETVNGGFKVKNVETIRSESNSSIELFGDFMNKHPNEEYMFHRLFSHNQKLTDYYKSIYTLWRYFSQFQHYSFAARYFIRDSKENFLYYFIQSLKDCYYFVFVLQDEVFQIAFDGFEANMLKVLELYKEYRPNR